MTDRSDWKTPAGVVIKGTKGPEFESILTENALEFAAALHRTFNTRRIKLLENRQDKQKEIDEGVLPGFLPETDSIRDDPNWRVGSTPHDLQKRWVEITGPVERKMMINALNSGADVFMADLEDSNSPTWHNVIAGQVNLRDAITKSIDFTNPQGKVYRLNNKTAVLLVRPRGWHLEEKNILVDNEPVSGSILDFALYMFHNCNNLLAAGTGPYFYLPKLENHHEAELWNDIFIACQKMLGIPTGTIKVTVLLETILASFEIEEILFALKEHIVGINAGRWDYIFSAIKKFRNLKDVIFPDRARVTMTVPFLRAYTDLLVKTCHKRGAHAMGGMSAFIPSRSDEEVNRTAFEMVRKDKEREVKDGFDGTWVAHPDLVKVARKEFEKILGENPHQKHVLREEVTVTADDLMNFAIPGAEITEAGLRQNINVSILYMGAWLNGNGAVALYNLMEDAATAEISRSQLWQWIHHPKGVLNDGRPIDEDLVMDILQQEVVKIKDMLGEQKYREGRYAEASELLKDFILQAEFPEFLTLEAYNHL